ncbi:MAG: hypothetical protein ACRD6Q_00050 [Nitrososphaeraceae archaeon]
MIHVNRTLEMQYQIIERFSLMVVIKYIKNERHVKQYYDASSIV